MLVFDFDGTLMDSMAGFGKIASQVIASIFNCSPEWAEKRYLETSGLPFPYQIEAIYPNDPRNAKAVAEFNRLKHEYYATCPFYGEVRETLSQLKASGHRLAVSSNNDRPLLMARLGELESLFEKVLGFEKGFLKGKDHFDALLKDSGLTGEEMVFVGDSLHDGLMARENGIPFVARTGTFTEKQFLSQNIAFACIRDLTELPVVLGGRVAH